MPALLPNGLAQSDLDVPVQVPFLPLAYKQTHKRGRDRERERAERERERTEQVQYVPRRTGQGVLGCRGRTGGRARVQLLITGQRDGCATVRAFGCGRRDHNAQDRSYPGRGVDGRHILAGMGRQVGYSKK